MTTRHDAFPLFPRIAVAAALAVIVLFACAPAAHAISRSRAELRVEHAVDDLYGPDLEGRSVLANCHAAGGGRWRCSWGALKNFDDGLNGFTGLFVATGSARVTAKGRVTGVTGPRWHY